VTLDRQPVLEGELVRVRPLQEGDFPALRAVASDPRLWEQHPSKDRTQPSVFRRWFDDALASGGALAVIDRRDGRVIGTSRFAAYDPERSEVEIGWTFLARSHWGGTTNAELKRLMLGHAFHSVRSVRFRVHTGNLRSQRAVEKLGAVRVGTEADPEGKGQNCVYRLEAPGGHPSDERWPTDEEVQAAKRRYVARMPGYEAPAAYGVGRLDGDGVRFGHVNDVGGVHMLPAVILAFVCGHRSGTATYVLGADAMGEAVRLLAPAEACPAYDHPNLWSWRALVSTAGADAAYVAVFVDDVATPPVDRHDEAFRSHLSGA
jgi:RimJ/RimL family protein N-acetyltransferase